MDEVSVAKIILEKPHKFIVKDILKKYLNSKKTNVWIFGSRANGKPRADSDLDLLFDPPLSLETRAKLSEDFEESNLPFDVDLVNRSDLAEAYKTQVEENKILFHF